MDLEDQVCSLELAKRLKELGVKQESLFSWSEWKPFHLKWKYEWTLEPGGGHVRGKVAAFTTAELGDMLPDGSTTFSGANLIHFWNKEKQRWAAALSHYQNKEIEGAIMKKGEPT